MGVAGLWDVLKPAAKVRSLTELAVTEGFQANPGGLRGYRIGIDASIWFFHAEYGKEGENPVLRTLFFRCATLMRAPFLPLFVFDGPKRPDFKRGKRINKTGSKLVPGMKRIVEAFGFEWRTAPGEAEAELAYLNRVGVIDGILSDDVDNFLFGALTLIRNQSNNLSGNKANPVLNSEGKDDKNHTRVYRFQNIQNHPDIQLTRGGMILIGLMSGGDYEGGLERCGVATAHALARSGLGDTLYEATRELPREELVVFLDGWRQELRHELRTNSRGFMARKSITLSKSIPDTFPNIDVLLSYVNPITSESLGHEGSNPRITWSKEPNLASLAAACELFFEWGYKDAILKRFRTILWPGTVLRILRRAVLDIDELHAFPATPKKSHRKGFNEEDYGTPSKMIAKHFSAIQLHSDDESSSEGTSESERRLIVSISRERTHVSTDGLLEYRLEVAPAQLAQMAESGIQGLRVPEGPNEWASDDLDEDGDEEHGAKSKVPIDPTSHLRLWMPACMVGPVEKKLIADFKSCQERKKRKKNPVKKVTMSKAGAKSGSGERETTARTILVTNRAVLEPSVRERTVASRALSSTASTDVPEKCLEVESLTQTVHKPAIKIHTQPTTPTKLRQPGQQPTGTEKSISLSPLSPFLRSPPVGSFSSDSEDELPVDIYKTVGPKKTTVNHKPSVKTSGYISISDDDDFLIFPQIAAKQKSLTQYTELVTSKTSNPQIKPNSITREPRKHVKVTSDMRQLQRSPQKLQMHLDPLHNELKATKETLAVPHASPIAILTDEYSNVGSPPTRKPNIPPLQLARARAKTKAAPASGRPRTNIIDQDVIDLT